MTQTQQHCSPDQLLAFLRGKFEEHEEVELQLHIDECLSCRERLENLAAGASVWNEAKQFLGSGASASVSKHDAGENGEASQSSFSIRQVLDALRPTDDPDSLGRIGGYEVTGVVGAGGMGVVLKAHDRSLDRIVAIKVMSPHLASSGSARMRFAREAKAAAAVLHPNVIAIHSVASDDEVPFLVMPFVRGTSLQKRIDSIGPLPLKDTLRIGTQIAAGLAAAHEQGLVHRDIKPANILLEEGVERVTITDFGLARAVDDASMTCSGVIAGTPQYMSPEQTRGEPVDARSDLFSLGSLLYAMCTGRSPFRAETTYGVLHRIANDTPTPVCEVNSDVPVWLGHIIRRLMSKRPEDRFESAAQVAAMLEGCLAHVQQPAAIRLPESVATLAPKIIRRPPFGKFIAAAAFAFAFFFAGVVIVLELDKGTLTIESEADDIPIRIMQGDKVVERLTVTKSGNTVRVASGTYVVELDGKLDGMTVENDSVALQRGATEVIKIRLSAKDSTATATSNNLHFDTPDALMKYAADCQSKGDATGFMACWTDKPFKDLTPSYLLTTLMQLQYFQNAPAGDKPAHPELLVELRRILTEEFADDEAGKSLLALALAHKEIADRSEDKFAEAAEATGNSPLVQLLASNTTSQINSRSFMTKIAALFEKYEERDPKQKPKHYAYTIQQDGDKAVAIETTGTNKFGLIKTDVGWRINELWYGLKAQDGSFDATKSKTNVTISFSDSLPDAIDQFNKSVRSNYPQHDQPDLTQAELIACASWNLQYNEELSESLKAGLTKFAKHYQSPEGWTVVGEYVDLPPEATPVRAYRISLVGRNEGERLTIRERYLEPPSTYAKATEPLENAEGTSLAAAIKRFNARYSRAGDQKQPPLTESEVVAAIIHHQTKRDEADVSDPLFEKLQSIATTRFLPKGASLELISTFGVEGGTTYTIWSARVVLEQEEAGREGWTYAFILREQFISVKHGDAAEIHWGKPAENGVQAGVRLSPPLKSYEVGQKIAVEVFYRNILTKQISATVPNFCSYKLVVLDENGTKMEVLDSQELIVGGARLEQLIGDEPTSSRGSSLAFAPASLAKDQREAYRSKTGASVLILVDPGKSYRLQFSVRNCADGADGEMETGELEISVE